MRIMMLSQFYAPIIGGGAIHVQSLSAELVARGYDVCVVTLWHQSLAEFELDRGVRVYRVRSSLQRLPWIFNDRKRQYAPPFPDPEVTLALRRLIAHEQPDIVHAHNWLVYSFLPIKAWSGVPLIVTLHDYNLGCAKVMLLHRNAPCDGPGFTKCLGCANQHYGLAKGVTTVLANRVMGMAERGIVDIFLPNSQATAAGNGLVGSRQPFQVIPHFLPDIGLQGDSNPYLAQLPGGDYLLFVGALGRLKGVDVLLRAYANLKNAPPLVLIGYQTPEWQTLSADCPSNVFVFENWPRYAVMEAWRHSMMALVPSVWTEPFGMVVVEAMSTGRPVIASRIGGLVDLVDDGETGFLVQPGDSLALQHAIEHLLANPDLRNQMGQAALCKFNDFNASTLVPRFERVYHEVVQQKVKPPRRIGLRRASEA